MRGVFQPGKDYFKCKANDAFTLKLLSILRCYLYEKALSSRSKWRKSLDLFKMEILVKMKSKNFPTALSDKKIWIPHFEKKKLTWFCCSKIKSFKNFNIFFFFKQWTEEKISKKKKNSVLILHHDEKWEDLHIFNYEIMNSFVNLEVRAENVYS